MFGMGFAEILIIGIIAILFLGPDKLPEVMVDIAKFFRSAKRTISSAKASLDEELHISDMKEEALNYKKELTSASEELNRMVDVQEVNKELNDVKQAAKVTSDELESSKPKPAAPSQPEVVTFPKKKKETPPSDEAQA